MSDFDQRAALERLVQERGSDYAGLSRLLGRNPAYIQQFIKRGSPRKLDEKDRKLLARFFGINESLLGGPAVGLDLTDGSPLIAVPRFDIGASAGPGAFADDERPVSQLGFDPLWLKQLTKGLSANLSLIRVRGDSMVPTLSEGDDILVNRSDAAERLRDGIYVLRREDTLMVKRIALSPASRRITIKSDNDAYPDWDGIDLSEIDVIGRVLWAGRRLD